MKDFWLKKIDSKALTSIIVVAIFFISMIPIMYLAIYSRPCVDDYAYSVKTHDIIVHNDYNILHLLKEAIKVDMEFYNTWQGLYSSAFILSLQPGIFGEKYYCIGTWILILGMFLCLYFFIRTVFKDVLKIKKHIFLITIAMLAVIITGLPSAVEGLYWFNGAWNYMPFLFLTLVNISLLLRSFYLNKKNDIVYSVILSFVISGGNHVTAFLNIMILIIFNVLTIRKNKKGIFSLVSAIIGFAVMYFAPGTSIRQQELYSQGVIDTLIESIKRCVIYFHEWHNMQWVLMITFLTPLAFCIKKERNLKSESLKYNPLYLLLTKICIICGMLCVPYKAMGWFGAGRVTNVIWITFMVLSCILWVYFIIWLSFRMQLKNKLQLRSVYKKIALIIICMGMVYFPNSNAIKATNEIINGTAQTFAFCCDLRYKKMKTTTQETIYVDKLPYDEMLRFDDITENVNDWRNKAWKEYYNKNVIITTLHKNNY